MQYDVSALKGRQLLAAIALADGRLVVQDEPGWPRGDYRRLRKEFGNRHVVRWYGSRGELGGWEPIDHGGDPSRDWGLGGEIIEREKLSVQPKLVNGSWYGDWRAVCLSWADRQYAEATGPTPLIAAMRCYVASVLGWEIDLPR